MTWLPHTTVAAVVCQDDRFLMVKERDIDGRLVMNQPAGHLEQGESLLDAVIRETREETGWIVEPLAILSLNLYRSPHNNITYFRCNYLATPQRFDATVTLDQDIEDVVWLSEEEILRDTDALRSPMVKQAILDYRGGQRYPLSLINDRFIAS